MIDHAAIEINDRVVWFELDGTIEIGKRSFETALLAEGHTPIGVGDGLLLAIELAPLNQIGTGDDGLIGRRARAVL